MYILINTNLYLDSIRRHNPGHSSNIKQHNCKKKKKSKQTLIQCYEKEIEFNMFSDFGYI